MARYIDVIDVPLPIDEAFDYLADFSHTVEWDPGVAEARCLTRGDVGIGSRFRVVVAFFGRRIPFEYKIVEFERPSRVVLRGGDASLRSIDEITFVARPGGTRVTYEARLELGGIRRLVDPLLDLLFQYIGRMAVRGLRRRMAEEGPRRGSPGRADRPASKRSEPARRSTSARRRPAVRPRKAAS